MAWSYEPIKTDKDAVRLLIGDTNACDHLLQDEEIEYLLQVEGSPLRAAQCAALTISGRFSRLADEKVGEVSIQFSKRAEMFKKLSNELGQRADVKAGVDMFAGGVSRADKCARASDGDRVKPKFSKDMHSNTGATNSPEDGSDFNP